MADLPSTPADGNTKVVFVPAIADTAAPKLTEINAVSAVDVSCYLTADGWTPGIDEGTIADARLCDTQTYERPGRSTRSLGVTYIENPTVAANNKAYTTLVPKTNGYFVVRRGTDFAAAFAVGDKVDVWPVTPGERSKLAPEANSVFRVSQKMFVAGRVREDVAVVA